MAETSGTTATDETVDDQVGREYANAVGARIRAVRRQRRLSLRAVEAASQQEFKASVLGAYERGERSISIRRLERLAKLYEVPVDELLPPGARHLGRVGGGGGVGKSPLGPLAKAAIDLAKLRETNADEADLLRQLLASVQHQRQDFNGRVITIRGDDLRVMAAMLGRTVEGLMERLDDLGLLYRG